MLKLFMLGVLAFISMAESVWAQQCPAFPHTLMNNSTADASQVMDDFQYLQNCPALGVNPSFTGNVGIKNSNPASPLQVGAPPTNGYTTGAVADFNVGTDTISAVAIHRGGTNNAIGLFLGLNETSAYAQIQSAQDQVGYKTLALNPDGGNVGIGTTAPSYLLTVNGTAYAAGAAGALSDIRHKKDIASLKDGALDNVMQLHPVSFQWKAPKDDGMRGPQMGFIAQEVEKVLPSAVLTQKDAGKTKGLKYNEIVAVLTKALQEQQAEIERLKSDHRAEIQQLRQEEQASIDALSRQISDSSALNAASLN